MLDHLVYAAPDPEAARARVASATGIDPSPGGSHPGLGTRNWLASLGDYSYLEIIGPDPDQAQPNQPRPFGLDDLEEASLVTWCARPENLDELDRRCGESLKLGEPYVMQRDSPEGLLSWRLVVPAGDTLGGTVPFFIDWQDGPHPSTTAAGGLRLTTFRLIHPRPSVLRRTLYCLGQEALGQEAEVVEGPASGLTATLRGPEGGVVL